jgi:hypothetical protein
LGFASISSSSRRHRSRINGRKNRATGHCRKWPENEIFAMLHPIMLKAGENVVTRSIMQTPIVKVGYRKTAPTQRKGKPLGMGNFRKK